MTRLRLPRLLLALLSLAVLAMATLATPASADDELDGDGCRKDCPETTTTTAEPEPEPTTTTEAPTTTTTVDERDETTTTTTEAEPTTTTTTWDDDRSSYWEWRRRTTTTTTTTAPPSTTAAPAPAPTQATFTGGAASTDRVPASFTRIRLTDTTFVAAETPEIPPSTLDPLTYEPVEIPTTTRPPVDRSDLETALASTEGSGSSSSTIFGISDTVIALVLGALAVALLGTGGIRRWLDRT